MSETACSIVLWESRTRSKDGDEELVCLTWGGIVCLLDLAPHIIIMFYVVVPWPVFVLMFYNFCLSRQAGEPFTSFTIS